MTVSVSVPAASTPAAPAETTSRGACPEAVSPDALSAQPYDRDTEPHDEDARPRELPRREPASLRGDEPRPAEEAPPPTSRPPQAAARRAFADELSAFSHGIQDALAARGITGGLVSATSDSTAIEEAPGHE